VYAFDLRDGSLRWRVPSRGSDREGGVARYFSPADCGPAFAGDRLFVADRAYYLSILDARTGERVHEEGRSVAVSPSPDGHFVYVRHTDHRVTKRRPDGSIVWEAKVPTGYLATPPIEASGHVWVLSSLGTLSALDAETGEVRAQYQAFPRLYAFSAPASDGERVYVVDMGGNVLALEPQFPR
jgi:outer membrane protein assembly factor BamB